MTSRAKPRRGRWRRVGKLALILLAGLALVLPALVFLGLRSPAVRGMILVRVASAVESRTGIRLTARDFRLELLNGAIEIEDLSLAAGEPVEAPSFLTVRRARAVVRWRDLLGDLPRIESLSIEKPWLDLGAPLPRFGDETDGDETDASDSAAPALEILELALFDGTLLGAAAGERMDVWLDAWRGETIELRGAYRSGRIEVDEISARLIVESHRREAVELNIDGAISGDPGTGEFVVDTLRIRGEGLTVNAGGRFAVSTPTANLAFDLDIEPAILFPDLTSGGRARGNGEIRLNRSPELVLGGLLRIDAVEIPAELASPWLDGVDIRGPLDPSGTQLDVDIDLDFALGLEERGPASVRDDRVSGNAHLTWRRRSEPLLTASVRSLAPDREGVHLSFDGALTPGAPGRRQISGELHAPSWVDLLAGSLRSARIDLDEPDLEQAVQRFGFDPEALPGWWPRGGVTANLDADGPLTAPRLRLDARWDHGDEILATLAARTLDGEGSLHLSCDAALLPEAPGRRELSGELLARGWDRIGAGELRDARLIVELSNFGDAEDDLTRRLPDLLPRGLVPDWIPDGLTEGRFSARVEASGPVNAPHLEVDAEWAPAEDESVRLVARGRSSAHSPFFETGSVAELSVRNLDISRLDVAAPSGSAGQASFAGRIDGLLRLDTSVEGIAANLRLDGDGLSYGELASIDNLRIEAIVDERAVELRNISGTLHLATEEISFGGAFTGSGRVDPGWPPRRGEARIAIDHPFEAIDRIETLLLLDEGTLRVERLTVSSAGNVASMEAAVPLGALAEIVKGLDAITVAPAEGSISVAVSNVDLSTLASLLDPEDALPPLHGTLDGSVTFDPRDPVASTGWLTVTAAGIDLQGETVEIGRKIRIEFADAKIVFPRTRLQPTGGMIRGSVPFELAATVELSPDWKPGDDLASAVVGFSVDLDGTVDAALLNPFLAGGAATGEVALTVKARGSMENLSADVRIRGPDATVFYRRPYPTRLEALEVDLTIQGREVLLERARARLNGGEAEITGRFDPDDGLDGKIRFEGAHYRIDFGIATRLSGAIDVDWPLDGRRRVAGRIDVERAVLRRPITLDREVLQALFDVSPESGANPILGTIDLDLGVLTDEGAVIRNNVAKLHADWGRLHITGTAADPLIEGRVDVRPGGIVTFLGVVYRIDEASIEWAGQPPAEPRFTLEWTSSVDDPSIIQSWRNELYSPADLGPGRGGSLDFWGQGEAGAVEGAAWQSVATGVATQATSATRTQLTYEPLPLFGETDTQARYTLSQDLSPQVTFIASTNPREAEAQTYIVDMHRLPVLPSFRAQFFTNDRKNVGLTIQQTLKLGRRPESEAQDLLLRSKKIEAPEGIRKRRLKRAIGYRRSDPFPEGAALDAEVDVSDALSRQGYHSADVAVDLEQVGRKRVDLHVSVEPGTRVSFVFEGDRIPTRTRKSIISAYRPVELGERTSLEDIQSETVEALHGLGYLDPRVDVDSAPADMANPEGPRVVRVIADGGRKVGLSQLVVEGVPDEEARLISELFDTTLSRVKLVHETPSADAALLQTLRQRGYPQPGIAGRSLSDDGETLVLRIEPGERQRLVSIEIEGLVEADRVRLAGLLQVGEGDPVRSDLIGQDARAIERDLRDRGHADARVRARVRPVSEDRPLDTALLFEVDPGPSYRIEEVRFEGLRISRRKWVERLAGLEPGDTFRQSDVAEARARLYRTGVFTRIRVSSEKGTPEAGGDTAVKFALEEARRWRLAYGGRWEDGRGLSGVVDLLDQNSLGRGHLSGIRAIYGSADKSLRFYHIIPRIVGDRSSLELLIEGKQERISSTVKLRSAEAWAQLTFPLTRRTHNRLYVRLQNPDLEQDGPDPQVPLDERVISPLLGWQLAFDNLSRRAGELRRQGIFIGVDFLGSHTAIGSDVTSFGVVSQLKYFMPIGRSTSGRFTWAQFWRGGWNEAKQGPVPFIDRFRAGGEFSVRGYPTNSLGPLGPDETPLGGELLFIVNQEIHADLFRTQSFGAISALAFFDAGNVWLDRRNVENGLFKSVGVGLRYVSPFGPIRLDFAVPLDRRPTDPASKLYIGFGSVF